MFDTHTHLNFSRFKKNVDEVIQRAQDAGVTRLVVPGTDIESSKKAVELAQKHDGVYAAVGIHPHHVFELVTGHSEGYSDLEATEESRTYINDLYELVSHPKVVAVGEIGLDRHIYKETKYESYHVDDKFISLQKSLLKEQITLAFEYKKSIILHNREATEDLLDVLTSIWDTRLDWRTVFHCCEANEKLLDFAKAHNIFIGVDGDITYDKVKQEFIKKVPLHLLVAETDSPFLLPEPMRSKREFPNEPKNIPLIISCIANILGKKEEELRNITTENGKKLFNLK